VTTIRTRDAIDGSYGADELRRASVIAPHPGERLFHHKEQNGALQLLARIQVAGDSIAASLDSRQTAEVVVRETCVLLDAEACLLFECPTGGAMRLIARRDSRTPRAISSADGIPGWVGTFPMSPVRADRQPKQARIAVDGEPRIVLALPAVHQEQVSGVIVVVGRSDRLFTVNGLTCWRRCMPSIRR